MQFSLTDSDDLSTSDDVVPEKFDSCIKVCMGVRTMEEKGNNIPPHEKSACIDRKKVSWFFPVGKKYSATADFLNGMKTYSRECGRKKYVYGNSYFLSRCVSVCMHFLSSFPPYSANKEKGERKRKVIFIFRHEKNHLNLLFILTRIPFSPASLSHACNSSSSSSPGSISGVIPLNFSPAALSDDYLGRSVFSTRGSSSILVAPPEE